MALKYLQINVLHQKNEEFLSRRRSTASFTQNNNDHLQEYQCSGQYSRYMNTMQPSQTDRMALDRDYKPMDCDSQVNISANDTVFDRLSNNRKNKYQSFEKQRVQKEMKDCSFQPLIQP